MSSTTTPESHEERIERPSPELAKAFEDVKNLMRRELKVDRLNVVFLYPQAQNLMRRELKAHCRILISYFEAKY